MIVVADDLGSGPGTDDAILALFGGVVDAASLLVNGVGFDEAIEHARPLPGQLGVHLCLTDGEPLTDAMRGSSRFCGDDGQFRLWRGAERAFHLGSHERGLVAAEFRAQIERARRAGVRIAHLDSHHHVHTEPAIAPIVIRLAREIGVPRVRLARNCGSGLGPANRAWKTVFNLYLRRRGLAGTKWFGRVEDYEYLTSRRGAVDSFELMVHPTRNEAGVVEDPERPGVELALTLSALRA